MNERFLKIQKRLSRGKTTIGIDIGTSSINMAQIARYKGKPTLIKTVVVHIQENKEESYEEAVYRSLKEAFAQFETKNAKFACVVNCSQTCVRKVITPYMPKQELKGAVSLEVKRSIPFSLEDAVIDFNVIEEVVDKGVEKLGILVAASPKETIDKIYNYFMYKKAKPFAGSITKKFDQENALKPLGIKISAFLPLALCIENIIEKSKLRVNETLVAIEMGTFVTELNIFKNARLQFSRKIPFSGKDLTKSLMGALMTEQGKVELNLSEAEEIKRKFGIPDITNNQTIDGKITTNHVLSLIRPRIEQLVTEIERSLDFYREEIHGQKVDRVVLFGGGAQLKGLPEFLSKEISLPVDIANPIQDINLLCEEVVPNEEDAHKLALAIGAALSGLKGINLLSSEINERDETFISLPALRLAAVPIVIMFIFWFAVLKVKISDAQEQFNKAHQSLSQLIPQLQSIQQQQYLEEQFDGQDFWGEALKEISYQMNDFMYLESLTINDQILNIRGVVDAQQGSPETKISRFMLKLEQGVLKNIRLIQIEKKTKNANTVSFHITCEVF